MNAKFKPTSSIEETNKIEIGDKKINDGSKNTILGTTSLFFKSLFPNTKNKENSINNNSKNNTKELEDEIAKLKKINDENIKEITRLKKDLEQAKNNNKELSKKIKNLETLLKEKDKKLESNKGNNSLDNNNKKLMELLEELRIKDKEIKDLKSRYPIELLEGEKLMSIIFISTDQKIHHSIICKNTDPFSRIERLLYDEYPEYLDSENYYIVNGNRINRHKTLEENNISNGNIITLYTLDE